MDYDRKSTTSSFYGRKGSMDALNTDYASHQPSRAGRDDASSFFNPSGNGQYDSPSTPGYNTGSYSNQGRQEPVRGGRDEESQYARDDDAWDVYADFNNAGPRYSKAPLANSDGYRALTPSLKNEAGTTQPVEMVTVPALGPEWGKDEMRNMSKAGKAERKSEARRDFFRAWMRGERGLCGDFCNRKQTVIGTFIFIVAVGIILAFTIPRVPGISFNGDSPLKAADGDFNASVPILFNRQPANFSFPAYADLRLNTQDSYVPITFNHMYAKIKDGDTGYEIGSGDLGHYTVPAKAYPVISLPITFSYIAPNQTDPTWVNWYDACKNKGAQQTSDGTRPGVKFKIELTMHIQGLPGTAQNHASISNAECPIELSMSAG